MLILRLDECSPITVPLRIIKDASFIKVIYIKTNYILYINYNLYKVKSF
jgi:hypothetical protein